MTGADFAEIEVTISNAQGMHGRPSSRFVRIASRYEHTDVFVVKDGMEVNGKSIFGLMMLAAGPGTTLRIRAQGPNAGQLCTELKALIDSHFGEEGVA